MADDLHRIYFGDIDMAKTAKTPEGLMVYGKAAGPDLDLDGQVCDPKWLAEAVPEWMTWGNVRESHTAIAAGVGKELDQKGDDWWLKALIVDPGTIAKVEQGVLKGMSIGIRGHRTVKDAKAPNGRIVAGMIPEISLVDRPCNPTAKMAIAKAAGGALAPVDMAGVTIVLPTIDESDIVLADARAAAKAAGTTPTPEPEPTIDYDQFVNTLSAEGRDKLAKALGIDKGKRAFSKAKRKAMAAAGHAMPGGEFPIETRKDVENAIGLSGSSNLDKADVQAHIKRQAARIGASDMIPDSWGGTDKVATATATKAKTDKPTGDADLAKFLASDTFKTLLADATAEATREVRTELAKARADLDKVLATPMPGGPQIMPAIGQSTPTTTKSAQALMAEHWRATAAATSDPGVANRLIQAAREIEQPPA